MQSNAILMVYDNKHWCFALLSSYPLYGVRVKGAQRKENIQEVFPPLYKK
jgi:hypothetical protein